jgi:2-keto-4-pentenoate hydratase/2-oxohepta-3-ene-1,7-dioic acid hydratase in catechol pathway
VPQEPLLFLKAPSAVIGPDEPIVLTPLSERVEHESEFDTFCPLGPWVVTHLRPEDIGDLGVTCRVNGAMKQMASTREMIFDPAKLIAYITAAMTLLPGDIIMTGTPAGVGPLKAGDVVEVEVEGVGVLRNPVIAS